MSQTTDAPPSPHFMRGFMRLTKPYWTEAGSWRPRVMVALVLFVVCAQVALALRLNWWSADLFDALERRSAEGALDQMGIFALIVAGTMATNTAHLVLRRQLTIDWRRWLTRHVVDHWMKDARHYQASLIPGDHANPDGHIAEDIRIATEGAVDLASSLFSCVLLLGSFIGILWSLSGWVQVLGINIPGHLVLLALLYAGTGTIVAFVLGRPLVRATNTRQTREADFRVSLLHAHAAGEPIALARGEATARARIGSHFEDIAPVWRDQSTFLARLVAFSSGYTTLAAVFPILVETPRFLSGALSLGGLMQSAQAFQQVTSALSWPVDNLPRIAEWRASVERVLALDEAVLTVTLEAARSGANAINLDREGVAWLGVRDLWIAAPDGTSMLADLTMQVAQGERVLVDGDPDAAAALFRVVAGIWPWGRGHVDLPGDSHMMAVGRRPFLSEGTLREVLNSKGGEAVHPDPALIAVLSAVGLPHLGERLDHEANWDLMLAPADLQRLSIARILLFRPSWIVLGNATDALDPASADALLQLLVETLPDAGVFMLGSHPGSAETFTRRLTLERAADGEVLLHEVHARRAAAQNPRLRRTGVLDWLRQGFGN